MQKAERLVNNHNNLETGKSCEYKMAVCECRPFEYSAGSHSDMGTDTFVVCPCGWWEEIGSGSVTGNCGRSRKNYGKR
jgi:hypothetical protein